MDKEYEEEFLEQVKDAAKKGAKAGAKQASGSLSALKYVPTLLLILVIIGGVRFIAQINGRFDNIKEQLTSFEKPIEDHDLVIEDDGFFGYTVADFADAILGEQSQLRKLEVLNQDVTDVTTVTEAGFAKWSALTKTQLITYHGKAIYTVDLSKLSKSDITLDDEGMVVTITVPHAVLDHIVIDSKDIEFGEVNKGVFAFGDIKLTPEQMAEIQTEAQKKMEEKVTELKIQENADKFAEMSVWGIYQPVVNSVAKGYSLKVLLK